MLTWLTSLFREAAPDSTTGSRTSDAQAPAGRFVEARDDGRLWRPVSQSKRDLSPVTQRRMQELAHHAWEQTASPTG